MCRFMLAAAAFAAILGSSASAETRPLSGFDTVSASGSVDVEVRVGPAFRVDIEGPRADRVDMRVQGRTLAIETRRSRGLDFSTGGRHARIFVTMPSLRGLDASAGAEVRAEGIDADTFVLDASSGGELEVEGRCGALSLDVSSGGYIRARDLSCRDVRLDASSGGHAVVTATATFTADASSGANVRWGGDAEIRGLDVSSGASLGRLQQD